MGEKEKTGASERVKLRAAEEKKLLKGEAKAARRVDEARARLLSAETKLANANARYDRRRAELLHAEDELRSCQNARAAGPGGASKEVADRALPIETEPESDASAKPEPV